MTRSNFQMGASSCMLCDGQEAAVLQLPAQPTTAAEEEAQKRVAYTG